MNVVFSSLQRLPLRVDSITGDARTICVCKPYNYNLSHWAFTNRRYGLQTNQMSKNFRKNHRGGLVLPRMDRCVIDVRCTEHSNITITNY